MALTRREKPDGEAGWEKRTQRTQTDKTDGLAKAR